LNTQDCVVTSLPAMIFRRNVLSPITRGAVLVNGGLVLAGLPRPADGVRVTYGVGFV
jgi:hypothetical protein